MKLYSENKNYKLYQGSMLEMLEVIESETIDSIVTDPPYELNFMGKGWDNTGIAFNKDTWSKCYEVLKPGGYLLAFGGSRTFHRIACAIEDAGFEIRDTIMWLYGSGFPKSMNIGLAIDKKNGVDNRTGNIIKGMASNNTTAMKNCLSKSQEFASEYEERIAQNEWNGWGTCLKPSFEPIIVARKPFKGSLVDNVIEYGVGGINIDECRIETNDDLNGGAYRGKNTKQQEDATSYYIKSPKLDGKEYNAPTGRFPANTILTYDETDFDEVCGGFPNTKSTPRTPTIGGTGGIGQATNFQRGSEISLYNDSGSASRYFYCAKASKKDRDEGLDDFEEKNTMCDRNPELASANMPQNRSGNLRKNTHPTVKPTELMQYLVRLVTPNGGVVLDPFNGSGSTGKAVIYENKERNKNYKYIGIELTEEYLPIAKARIEYISNLKPEQNPQVSIYDLAEEND